MRASGMIGQSLGPEYFFPKLQLLATGGAQRARSTERGNEREFLRPSQNGETWRRRSATDGALGAVGGAEPAATWRQVATSPP